MLTNLDFREHTETQNMFRINWVEEFIKKARTKIS